MLYRIYPQTNDARLFTEPRSRCKIPYRTAKEMRERYPNGEFDIIGEIGSFARPPTSGDWLLTGEEKAISISPRGSLKRPFEWIAGYVAVDKNAYLAAIGSLIPSFLRR